MGGFVSKTKDFPAGFYFTKAYMVSVGSPFPFQPPAMSTSKNRFNMSIMFAFFNSMHTRSKLFSLNSEVFPPSFW